MKQFFALLRMMSMGIFLLLFFLSLSNLNAQSISGPENSDLLAPEIFISPSSLAAYMWIGPTFDVYTTIFNNGNSTLYFSFPEFIGGTSPPGYITEVVPSSGYVSPGGQIGIVITYSAVGYTPGIYYQDIEVASDDPINPVVIISNAMHVYLQAYIHGVVNDAVSMQPIVGATVSVDSWWSTQTLADGSYHLAVNEDTYDIFFQKLGYGDVIVYDTSLVAGDTTYIDVEMPPLSYPTPWVIAEVNYPDEDFCAVQWGFPTGPAEIIYDDGTAEDLFVWTMAGSESAVRYTPSGYPATVFGGRVFVGGENWPSGNWMGTQLRVLVYDEDVNGLPGNVLDSIQLTVSNYYWIEFMGFDVSISSGAFFISIKQMIPGPDAAPVGVDMGVPLENRSYTKMSGGTWELASNPDFMIRAYCDEPTSNPIDYFIVSRMSDFDPNLGPASGTMTPLVNTTSLEYWDDLFPLLPEGWYAYAVQAIYNSGMGSSYTYSNVVGVNMRNEVTFIISDCLLGPTEGFVVSALGLDWPYELYVGTTDINGICEFDFISTGNWEYTISKCGYEDYVDSDYVDQDLTYEIIPVNKLYNPRNLSVDTVTAFASWDEPMITALLDDFEQDIYSNGWEMTSNGIGWIQTDDGGSNGFYIPSNGSNYVCVNDDAAGAGNDGCCDMLITPELDLCVSDNYMLSFDSYFTGVNGQQATVEYTLDAGSSWTTLYTLSPAAGVWEPIEIDLSAFSGANASEDFHIAFHADDGGGQASGWAIDNVDINAGPASAPTSYFVYLDGIFVSTSDTTNFEYPELSYGQVYVSGVAAFYDCGLSDDIYEIFTSGYLAPPSFLEADTLAADVKLFWVYDTASMTAVMPDVFGFNLYRDSIEIAFVPYSGQDTSFYTDVAPDPMCYDYHVSTMYDLSMYTYPGDTGESLYTGPAEVCLTYGTTLPFSQNFDSGSFGSFWVPDENWRINGQYGNPMPSAEFTWNPIMTNYEAALTSGPINGVDHDNKSEPYVDGDFILAFDLKLDDNSMSGNEYFNIEVWSNGVWTRMNQESNANGSFDWKHKEINITEEAMGNVFKVRFAVTGEVSSDILSWLLDNISIERVCYPPTDLTVDPIDPFTLYLQWIPPVSSGGGGGEWLMWDDGVNAGDGIGLTAGGTFSVASHWDPDMISQYDGMFITKIRFFAYDNAVTSSFTLNVWEGPGVSMIYEEAVSGVVVGTWNEVTLSSPVMINASQELWFGYTVTHPAGENPAGFDDGPGNPGYGDMICTDGTTWEPLSNLIAFDGNWNIQAFVGEITDVVLSSVLDAEKSTKELLRYDIYWNDNGGVGDFEFLDSTQDTFYSHFEDPPFIFGTLYTYRVYAMYEDCEAMDSVTIIWEGIDDNGIESSVWIYPNPSNDLINIESTKDINKLCLLDYSGRMLQCHELSNETHYQIDVSGYEPGVYLLRIDTEQGRAVRKLVVME